MAREQQREFFSEFEAQEPRLKNMARKVLPRHRWRIVSVSFENILLTVIFFIFGIIIAFVFGFEMGKGQGEPKISSAVTEAIPVSAPADMTAADDAAAEKEDTGGRSVHSGDGYTIQLISYRDKRKAEDKTRSLNAAGDAAHIISTKKWHQVCVGSYVTRDEALEDLVRFSSTYKDCYLRRKNE